MMHDFKQEQGEKLPHGPFCHEPRTWQKKFQDAFRGLVLSIRQQSSFRVHLLFAILVPMAAFGLQLDLVEWCILLLSIFAVMSAEMFNTAIETLAKAITKDHNMHIGLALDIASGAVLLVCIGASLVGACIFIQALVKVFC